MGVYAGARQRRGASQTELMRRPLGRGVNLSSFLIAVRPPPILLPARRPRQLGGHLVRRSSPAWLAGIIIGQSHRSITPPMTPINLPQRSPHSAKTGPATVIISGIGIGHDLHLHSRAHHRRGAPSCAYAHRPPGTGIFMPALSMQQGPVRHRHCRRRHALHTGHYPGYGRLRPYCRQCRRAMPR